MSLIDTFLLCVLHYFYMYMRVAGWRIHATLFTPPSVHCCPTFKKAYTFGAIMNRDDVFNSIRDAAEGLGCIWRQDNNKSGSS
jgi:hypothetical protein